MPQPRHTVDSIGPDVRGKHLKGREAGLDHLRDLGHHCSRDVTEQHAVIGVIGVRLPLPAAVAFFDSLKNIPPWPLDGKIHQRCGAPKYSGPTHLVRWGRLSVRMSHDGRRHVRMWLNPTGDDDLAAGVEDVPLSVNAPDSATATIFSPRTPMSHSPTPPGVTTCPPLMT